MEAEVGINLSFVEVTLQVHAGKIRRALAFRRGLFACGKANHLCQCFERTLLHFYCTASTTLDYRW